MEFPSTQSKARSQRRQTGADATFTMRAFDTTSTSVHWMEFPSTQSKARSKRRQNGADATFTMRAFDTTSTKAVRTSACTVPLQCVHVQKCQNNAEATIRCAPC